MSTTITSGNPLYGRFRGTGVTGVTRVFGWARKAFETYRERRQLLALSDATLKDIGVSRADAEREASRSFWDLPDDEPTDRSAH